MGERLQRCARGRQVAGLMLVLSICLVAGCARLPSSSADPQGHSLVGREYMVAADHPLASRAGAKILAAGGNAVDAAVATSFALGVTRPYSAGIGGGGFMMIKLTDQPPVIIDYRETAAAACTLAAYLDDDGQPIAGKTRRGHWSVGVPGQLRGVALALDRYGTMPLATVMQPAIDLAEDGFPVDEHTHGVMASLADRRATSDDARERTRELARIYLNGERPYGVGETLRQPDLAATLRIIARDGAESFYAGDLARRIVVDMRERRGPIMAADLLAYEPRVREPLVGSFRGHTVFGMPPPSSGGACLIQMLRTLDGIDWTERSRATRLHVLVECMKHAYADRSAYLGDADFDPRVTRDVEQMISPARAAKIGAAIDIARTQQDPRHYGSAYVDGDAGTTHFCVVDAEGNAVSATETVNWGFGSEVVVPGTGIVLNNELDDFTVTGSPTNAHGLAYSDRNVMRPGRRPLSSMSPTMVLDDDQIVAVAGASGGQRIITATLQVLLGIFAFDLDVGNAVVAPRVHHQWIPDKLSVDEGVPEEVIEDLRARGHAVGRFRYHSGVCQVIHVRDGRLHAASDPRKGGAPAGR